MESELDLVIAMNNLQASKEKGCHNCCWNDIIFGDCCHPKGGGALSLKWATEECVWKGYQFWEPINEKTCNIP